MEGIPVRSVIPSASTSHSHHLQRKTIIQLSSSSTTKLLTQNRCLRFSVRAKLSSTDFQDFRSYARPSHLLPASEVKVYTDTSVENISSLKEGGSKSLYRVKLCTSSLYGSSISDLNAGILLCLIDENGNSILQRIPVSLMMDHSTESGDITNIDMLHFQRGSADEFIFEGPKIARLEALWVSVESAVASFSAGENAGIDFLIGGVGGFLYLLLLQRSVDELPASELITSDKGRSDAFFRGIKGPIASVALALGLAVIATRYSSGDLQVMLTPKDLIFGMMGFLVCKISVLLAAFKPIALGSKLPTDM